MEMRGWQFDAKEGERSNQLRWLSNLLRGIHHCVGSARNDGEERDPSETYFLEEPG
jgi:hypothetical protein